MSSRGFGTRKGTGGVRIRVGITATWLAAQNTDISRAIRTATRLRVGSNATGDQPTQALKAGDPYTNNWLDDVTENHVAACKWKRV